MNSVGFEQIRPGIFKAIWSSPEVEHFAYFSWYGQGSEYLAAHYGIRNPHAEAFSANSIRTYGGEFLFNALAFDEATSCSMRFSFGRLTPATPRWFLDRLKLSSLELTMNLRRFLEEKVLPVVSNVIDIDKLLSILLADSEPFPWFVSNGAIRAAKIAALAQMKDLDPSQTTDMLNSRESQISRGFMKTSIYRDDPSAYVEKIISDARRQANSARARN